MKNMQAMMKQAQQMQAKMQEAQDKLDDLEVEGKSGGGLVTATATGKGALKGLKIDPSLIDPEDPEMLEDLIIAAVNDARVKADEAAAESMKSVTGGLNLPGGMKLPF